MLDSTNHESENYIGMLFLFDVKDSSELAATSEALRNSIFYQKISLITKSVVDELNQKFKSNTKITQNTGDGCYIFSLDAEIALHLWLLLNRQFSAENLQIRCGAGYGRVSLNEVNIGSHLGNIVSRCCSYNNDSNTLIVTAELYNLIKDSSFFLSVSPKVRRIDNPNLKGCKEVTPIYQLVLSGNSGVSSRTIKSSQKNASTVSFYGREKILDDCKQVATECFLINSILSILGVSGVGKTTLAMSVSSLLGFLPICVDLRQITILRELHRLLVDVLFEKFSYYNLTNEVAFEGKSTLLNIFSKIHNIVLVFDHAELLEEQPQYYVEIINLFPDLRNCHICVILTSTCNVTLESMSSKTWYLRNPTDSEKVSMLSHWIETRETWLASLASHITNHSYLICLVGHQYQGKYNRKKDIVSIENLVEEAGDVSNYLIHILEQLPMDIRFWVYLAYLCHGSVYTKAIPKTTLEIYTDRGLIKEIGETTVFHPLVMRAVETEHSVQELQHFVFEMLCTIHDDKCKTMVEYYKYLCLDVLSIERKKSILIYNWQTWSEEIDSYKTQALIEQLKIDMGLGRSVAICDLFSSIINIFQGNKDSLEVASQKCEKLAENNATPLIIRLLAKLESIECQRKLNGPAYAISLIYDNMESFNHMISIIKSEKYMFEGKYYYLGTFYFLIGNILRSLEDHGNAVSAYNVSLRYINMENPEFRNADLQKVHISYGIAESYLKNGQFELSIELADENLRTTHTTAKFGVALLYLLKARAFLCSQFARTDNYDKALKSVKKAEALFNEIRLPNYIQRCNFVEAAIYTKRKRYTAARKRFVEISEHLSGTDDMSYRVNIFLNYIIGISGLTSPDEIRTIIRRKGKQIGLFFENFCGIEGNISFESNISTIRVEDDVLCEDVFSINADDLDNHLWLVD